MSDVSEVLDLFGFQPEPTKTTSPSALEVLPTKVSLTFNEEDASALLAFVDAHFHQFGEIPKFSTLLAYWPKAGDFLDSGLFTEQLKLRGIPYKQVMTPDGFPVGFINAANLILDYSDKRTKTAKLKSIGLSTREWNGFLKVKKCREYFERGVNEIHKEVTPLDAKLSMSRLVENGDLNAIKYLNELNGTYRPGQESLLNLTTVLAHIMEILVEYVTPDKLPQVAARLDAVIETTAKELGSA